MLPNIDTAPSSAIRSTMKLIEVVVYNVLNFCWLYPQFPCLITIPSGTQVTYGYLWHYGDLGGVIGLV